MLTNNIQFKLSVLATIMALGVQAKPALAENDHRLDNGVNKSGQRLLVIDKLVCEGNTFTDCDFITKKFYQQKGDIVDSQEISDAKLRLNRLLQFVYVDVRLEQSRQKDHVVVVFDVIEAEENQYNYFTDLQGAKQKYSYCDRFWQSDARLCHDSTFKNYGGSLGVGMTDYDFFDTGAAFSIGVSGNIGNASQDINYLTASLPDYVGPTNASIDSDNHGFGLHLAYFDPHLFGSRDYYLRATYSRNHLYGDTFREFDFDQEPRQTFSSDDRSTNSPASLEVGRRFARHSFASIHIDRVRYNRFSNADAYTAYGLKYGWDSRDDTLFATQGSTFNVTYSYARLGSANMLDMDYTKYLSLSDNAVLSWQLNGGFIKEGSTYEFQDAFAENNDVFSYGLGMRYTSISNDIGVMGTKSGWFTELKANKVNRVEAGLPNTSIAFNAGYTFQSPGMIYNFTLGLSTAKSL